jgi:erythromycin esterase-like protein
VVDYLERVDPALARDARKAYRCFEPYAENPQAYAKATVIVPTSCEAEAVRVLQALRAKAPDYREDGIDSYYNAEQNALVAHGAERYYRAMVRGGSASWNIRDRHMSETLERLMRFHGKQAKAVVWEHNTHVGDARFTDMAAHGMVNLGQLVREAHDESQDVVLVGFGTYSGSVLAATHWGAPMECMRVPEARSDSLEDLLHRAAVGSGLSSKVSNNLLLIFDGSENGGIAGLDDPVKHRAIGVVYDPDAERRGNYVPTILPRRYDAFLFIDHTHAVNALHMAVQRNPDLPETFPSGM